MLYNSIYKAITGAHVHLGDGLAEFFHSFGVGFGVFVQQGCGHLCVAMYAWVVLEAEALDGSRFTLMPEDAANSEIIWSS